MKTALFILKEHALSLVCMIGFMSGAIVFALGVSFSVPPADHVHEYYLRQHAELITVAGIGILFISLGVSRLADEVRKLRKEIKELR